ncbi:MAG: hypothetical protein ACRETX_14410, partial [Steroidobacteraceae bacterium]
AVRDAGLDQHLARCSACRAFLERVGLRLEALSGLKRLQAPRDLDGRAVAATQAGFRQDRAIAALQTLDVRAMPRDLDQRMWPDDAKAPRVLDRLVASELDDPARALARRFVGRLERLRAPRELDAAVKRRAIGGRSPRSSERMFAPILLFSAAAVVLAIGLGGTLMLLQKSVAAAPGPRVVIERVNSLYEMSPELVQAFAQFSGGVADPQLPKPPSPSKEEKKL